MRGNEIIELDAEVVAVLNHRVFRARLGNGHECTAFVPREQAPATGGLCPAVGARLRVRLSPFDMSRGEVMEIVES